MNNNFSLFLLFSVLLTGLIISPVYAQEPPVNATETMTESNSTSTETMTESNSTSTETMTESNSTSTTDETMIIEEELETELNTEDEMTETEVIPSILSPLKQIKEGVVAENVVCKEGLGLVFKLNGQPACVKTTSIEKLIAWGWAR